ncbi:hypothetical protein [Streptococcus uberis]|uniref:hypothetical protein n=1 Tax=Streptococcus uberis TaxID=1349 RepID=UPI0012B5CED2|nr:hypothetical protein [Streptococcus uberis]MTB55901.1 hypothetical protein [Streptococcus uberis]
MGIKQELKDLKNLNNLIKVMESENMIEIVDDLTKRKNETIAKIYNLNDSELIEIMLLRHFDGLTWDEISSKTGFSKSKLMTLNKRAMDKFKS